MSKKDKKTLLIGLFLVLLLSIGSSFASDTPGSSFKKADPIIEKEVTAVLDTSNKYIWKRTLIKLYQLLPMMIM